MSEDQGPSQRRGRELRDQQLLAGMAYQQIAERLNRPAGTARSDISRAMQHMRKRLTEQRGGDKMIQKGELSLF